MKSLLKRGYGGGTFLQKSPSPTFADPIRRLVCEVERTTWLTADLALLELRPPEPVTALPGQFALLRPLDIGPAPLLGRPMSVLAAGDTLRFLVRRCGEGTRLLTSRAPGDRVLVLAPLGRPFGPLDARESAKLALVAGGVGLAPLAFAARGLAATGLRPLFLHGARRASELVLGDELSAAVELRLSTDDGSAGHHGPVTDLLEVALERREVDRVWTCGPEPMMAAVARLARSHGVPCQVSVEARMACGRGLCLGCARPDVRGEPRYVCHEGPVFEAEDLYDPEGGYHG